MFIRPLMSLFRIWLVASWLNLNAYGQVPRNTSDFRLRQRVAIKYTRTDTPSCGIITNPCVLKHESVTMNHVRVLEVGIVTWNGRHGHLYAL